MMKEIKTIFFDLGNVIIRFDPAIIEKKYASFGKIKEDAVVKYVMESDNMNKYMEGKLSSSQFYSKTRRFFKMDIKYHDFYDIWNSMFYPYPEMEEIVRAIKAGYPDIKLILVSNTNQAHYDFLIKEYSILELMDAYVLSHEVGKQKPSPVIFKEALRVSGSLPRETFYTDDRPELIDAARVLGIRAFTFTGHEQLREQLCCYGVSV